jgi:energy-coupling factor transporter transmembrane protein EcfT
MFIEAIALTVVAVVIRRRVLLAASVIAILATPLRVVWEEPGLILLIMLPMGFLFIAGALVGLVVYSTRQRAAAQKPGLEAPADAPGPPSS